MLTYNFIIIYIINLFISPINLVLKHAFQDQTPVFCAGVLESLTVELKASKDFSKLYAGIAILGYIASLSDSINVRALSHLLTFLGHRYPKVCGTYQFS